MADSAPPAPARSGSGTTKVAFLITLVATIVALFYYQQQQDAQTQVRLSQQYIVTALLKPVKEKLDRASYDVSQMNYGNASEMLRQCSTMFQSASQVLGQWGSPELLTRLSSSVAEAQKAVDGMSPDAPAQIETATKQVEMAEVLVAQNSIAWARDQAKQGNFEEAKAFLTQTATLFEDATRVEGMESNPGDWRDQVIDSLATSQKALNDFAETSVKELDGLSLEFQKVRWAKGQEVLASAREQVLTGDYTRAKKSIEEFSTLFEQANQVEGMEREDWTDDVIATLGNAQKSVNDFAEKATPAIDGAMKTIGDKISGK